MSDRTIAMLIQQQRIELGFEFSLAALLLAAVILGSVGAVQMLRHRSTQTVTRALVVATLLTITSSAIQHQVRTNHRIARDRAMADDPCMFQADRTDGAEDTASLNDGAAEEVRS
jgi:Flp pilus assembly protein TadG